MTRAVWKGPFIEPHLYSKIIRSSIQLPLSSVPLRIWSRKSTILPECVGLKFEIHNGKVFYPVLVTENMVGHKFGEFSHTRKICLYKKSKKKKKG
jgi:small subunit ribosomal protein S19